MVDRDQGQKNSGASKVWEDFAERFPAITSDDSFAKATDDSNEFRDEYIRLPYDGAPHSRECRW